MQSDSENRTGRFLHCCEQLHEQHDEAIFFMPFSYYKSNRKHSKENQESVSKNARTCAIILSTNLSFSQSLCQNQSEKEKGNARRRWNISLCQGSS